MKEEQKKLAKYLTENCNSYDEWLTVMNFGMPSLLKDTDFLYELIREKAESMPQDGDNPLTVSQRIRSICKDLNLKFELYINPIPVRRPDKDQLLVNLAKGKCKV
jgi:hypothetical protein